MATALERRIGTIGFRHAARIPKGVTPEGIVGELQAIEDRYGDGELQTLVDAVIDHPDQYPNLRAFGPADEEEAMRRAIAVGIDYARSIVVQVIERTPGEVSSVRTIWVVKGEDGKTHNRMIEQIVSVTSERNQIIEQVRREANRANEKLNALMDELQEIAAS